MEQESIIVVPLGFEERSRRILNSSLQKKSDGVCQLGEPRQAQIALLDLDNSGAEHLLNESRQLYPDRAVIGIGKEQSNLPIQAFVAKPLNQELLLSTILDLVNLQLRQTKNMITEDKIARAMQALDNRGIARSLHKRSELSETRTVAKRAMPNKTDEMCFVPERFLLGCILTALSQASAHQQTAVLTCWNNRTIIIEPDQYRISTNLNDSQIRNMAIAPIDDNLTSPIDTKFYQSGEINRELDTILTTKDLRHFSQESFLWNLALLTCRGRIPAEFTVSNRHYLRRWPNLTRMNVPANAMRILAYWSQQPCSLSDIKQQLDIPLQDIFTVFSAAYAAGLTGEAKRRSDQIMDVIELGENNKRGLMKSIIHRLRVDKSKSLPRSA